MDRDLRREQELLQLINRSVVNGTPIAEHSYMGDEALWQAFQQFLLDAEILEYLAGGSFATYVARDARLRKPSLKAAAMWAGVAVINLVGVAWLILSRREVLVFSVDKVSDRVTHSDFRIAPLYAALHAERVPFVECFHTVLTKSTFWNLGQRMRAALYLEGIDALWHAARAVGLVRDATMSIESAGGTDDERKFIEHVIRKYYALFPLIAFRTKFFELVLRFSAVRLMVGVDDARHYHALIEACRRRGVKSVVLQHGAGHYSQYHPGWLGSAVFGGKRYMRADVLVVWSEYWTRMLAEIHSVYPPSSIHVGGAPTVATHSFAPKIEKRVVLVPHETESNKVEVARYLVALASCPGAHLYFKVRSDLSQSSQCAEYGDMSWKNIHVVRLVSDIPRPDVVVGVYSTFLYDMIAVGIPVLRMETAMEYGSTLLSAGLVSTLPLNGLCDALAVAEATHQEILEARKKILNSELDLVTTLRGIIVASTVH